MIYGISTIIQKSMCKNSRKSGPVWAKPFKHIGGLTWSIRLWDNGEGGQKVIHILFNVWDGF